MTKKNHHFLNYRQAREALFGIIFLESDENGSFIKDIYCNKIFRENDGVGPLQIPNSKKLNTEHSWPKKYFSKNFPFEGQESDLFHLYPSDTMANSYRGHLEFSEIIKNEGIPDCPVSERGFDSLNQIGFEPPDQIKGDLARSLFYFSVRYKVSIPENEEETLRKWSLADPVDNKEKLKNDQIMEIQGNRNPFIDRENLIGQIKDF
jgi:endonuclease I